MDSVIWEGSRETLLVPERRLKMQQRVARICPAHESPPYFAGNLLRNGDARGFNSMARMYTLELAKPPNTQKSK